MKKLLLAFIFGILLISLASVSGEEYKVGLNTIQMTCTIGDAVPSASATMNLSIFHPNGSTLISNQLATAHGQGSFSYDATFPSVGNYLIKYFCYDGTESFGQESPLVVTPLGQSITDAESKISTGAIYFLLVLGIVFIGMGFMFMRGGFWLGWTGIFFIAFGMIFLYYDLSLVNYYVSTTALGGSTTNSVFLLVAKFIKLLPYISWLIVAFAIIGIFKIVKKNKTSHDGWDNNKY